MQEEMIRPKNTKLSRDTWSIIHYLQLLKNNKKCFACYTRNHLRTVPIVVDFQEAQHTENNELALCNSCKKRFDMRLKNLAKISNETFKFDQRTYVETLMEMRLTNIKDHKEHI